MSHWAAREVTWWRRHKPIDHLLIALSDGEVMWDEASGDFDLDNATALPAALRGPSGRNRASSICAGQGTKDLTLRHPQFRDAVGDLTAPLHGRESTRLTDPRPRRPGADEPGREAVAGAEGPVGQRLSQQLQVSDTALAGSRK